MDILSILLNSGNGNLISQIASQVNTDNDNAKSLTEVVGVELLNQIQNRIASGDDSTEIEKAITNNDYAQLVDEPNQLENLAVASNGATILDKILGSENSIDNIASNIANKTGFDLLSIKNILPVLAPIIVGAISKSRDLNAVNSNINDTNAQSSILSILDLDKDGSVIDDIFDMAKKLF